MQVPSNVLDHVFEKDFVRGAVLLTEMQFQGGEKRSKYLIVLNKNPLDTPTLIFLTTSQTSYFDRHPQVDHIRLPAASISYFPKETIIDCREVSVIDRVELKKRYQEGILRFVGCLPLKIMEKIDRIVASSRFISVRYKKDILGWK